MPAPNDVGIHAIWDNKDFVRGMKAYTAGLQAAGKTTTTAAKQATAMNNATAQMANTIKSFVGPIIGVYGVRMLARGTVEMAKMGAQAKQMEIAFGHMATRMGGDANDIIKSLRKASLNTIDDMKLMQAANMAMAGGLGANAEELGQLMEVAVFKAREAGISVEFAWDSLTKGIARRQKLILDNLFIYNLKMDETTSTADIMAQVIREGQKDIARAGGVAEDAATKFQAFDAKIINAKTSIGKLIIEMGLITTPIDLTIKGIEGWERAAASAKTISEFLGTYKGGPEAPGGGMKIQLMPSGWQEFVGKGIAEVIKSFLPERTISGGGGFGGPSGAGFAFTGEAMPAREGSTALQNLVAHMKDLGKQKVAANVLVEMTNRLKGFKAAMEQQKKLQDDSYNLYVSQNRAREEFQHSERQALDDYNQAVKQTLQDFHDAEKQAEQIYYQQRTTAVANYNLATQRAEEDHQIKMARLRQQYDITQEDNIRSQDAIAYLRERRNYNVTRKNAETDYGIAAKRRSDDFAVQLQQMEESFRQQQGQREIDYRRTLSDLKSAQARERNLRQEAFYRQQRMEYDNFIEQERIAAGYYDRAGVAWSNFLAGIVSSVSAASFPAIVSSSPATAATRSSMDVSMSLSGGGSFDAGLKQEILSTVRDVIGRALG